MERTHLTNKGILEIALQQSGRTLKIAGTSCRVVNFATFEQELTRNGFVILEQGVTSVEPDFPQMMYAVVKNRALG